MDVVDTVFWVVIGAILVVAVVLIGIEAKIMHKPESQRSERERRFIRADRRAARGNHWYARNIAPWLAIGVAVVGLVLTVPFWVRGQIAGALLLTATFVVLGVAVVLMWVFVLRKRGAEWRRKQDEANSEADAVGRPRWFVSVRAGVLLGGVFTLIGVILLVFGLVTTHVNWLSIPVIGIGVLVIVLALIQGRGERRTGGGGAQA